MLKELTPPEGRPAPRERHAGRRKRDQDLSLIDCLQFCEKRDLIGIHSKRQGRQVPKGPEQLRDGLSHAQRLADGIGWTEAIDVVVKVESLIEWSETAF